MAEAGLGSGYYFARLFWTLAGEPGLFEKADIIDVQENSDGTVTICALVDHFSTGCVGDNRFDPNTGEMIGPTSDQEPEGDDDACKGC